MATFFVPVDPNSRTSAERSDAARNRRLVLAAAERLFAERCVGEVTMEEVVTLYSMLANRGVLRPLRYRASDQSPVVTRLLSEEASFMTLEMLHENPRPDGVFSGARAGVRRGDLEARPE